MIKIDVRFIDEDQTGELVRPRTVHQIPRKGDCIIVSGARYKVDDVDHYPEEENEEVAAVIYLESNLSAQILADR